MRTVRALHGRGGRRALAPLVGLAFAAALLAGCGGASTGDPTEEPSAETSEQTTVGPAVAGLEIEVENAG